MLSNEAALQSACNTEFLMLPRILLHNNMKNRSWKWACGDRTLEVQAGKRYTPAFSSLSLPTPISRFAVSPPSLYRRSVWKPRGFLRKSTLCIIIAMIIISDPKLYVKSLNSSLSGVRSLRWKLGEAEETRSTGVGGSLFWESWTIRKKTTEGGKKLKCREGGDWSQPTIFTAAALSLHWCNLKAYI